MAISESGTSSVALLGEPAPRFGPIVREILKVALPNITSYVMTLTNELANTLMLGHTGDEAALAAVGLANMMQNCCGLSVGFGIANALDTLVSQAHGAQQHELSCHQLQRCRVLVTLQMVWMVPLLWYSGDLLLWMHQDPDVARHAGEYNRASVFGLFGVFQYEATRKFLCNRENVTPTSMISVVTSLLHVGWVAFFVLHLKLGNAGAGYANAVTWWTECLLVSLYLACRARRDGLRRRAVLWLEKPAFREWGSYMRLAVPATLQLCSEWWFWEISAMVVGYLGKVALAAHVTALNWVAISFMPAIGVSASAATLVGNALGANMPRKAKYMGWTCAFLNIVIWTGLAAAMSFFRHPLSAVYSKDTEIRDVMQRLLLIFAVAGYFDSSQNVMGGTLRGCGRQLTAAVTYVLAYYGVMLPSGIVAAYTFHFGIYGMWFSMGVGTCLVMIVFIISLCRTDWPRLAEQTASRLEREGTQAVALVKNVGSESSSARTVPLEVA